MDGQPALLLPTLDGAFVPPKKRSDLLPGVQPAMRAGRRDGERPAHTLLPSVYAARAHGHTHGLDPMRMEVRSPESRKAEWRQAPRQRHRGHRISRSAGCVETGARPDLALTAPLVSPCNARPREPLRDRPGPPCGGSPRPAAPPAPAGAQR